MTQVKDFSKPRKKIIFRIDEDVFEAAPVMPAQTLLEFSVKFAQTQGKGDLDKQLVILRDTLEMVLLPESFDRFASRLSDRERPIELGQLSDVVMWLLEEYGLRPTRPSSASLGGSPGPESGTPSTGSTPAEESISSPSLPIAS